MKIKCKSFRNSSQKLLNQRQEIQLDLNRNQIYIYL